MAKREYNGDPIDMTQQHISERDLDDEADEVEYATDPEQAGQESVTFWPSSAPPRETLNETQIAVIEAAADPTREFETAAELSRQEAPEFCHTYAANVLHRYYPESELTRVDSDNSRQPNPRQGQPLGIQDPKTVDKIRNRLVGGDSSSDVADEFGVSQDVVLAAAKGSYDGYEEMGTQTPPVEYTDGGWTFVEDVPAAEDEPTEDGGGDVEDESDAGGAAGESEDDDEEALNHGGQPAEEYTPDPASRPASRPVADADTDGPGVRYAAVTLTAVALWVVARRVISRIR
jgi:hypothetical protein